MTIEKVVEKISKSKKGYLFVCLFVVRNNHNDVYMCLFALGIGLRK